MAEIPWPNPGFRPNFRNFLLTWDFTGINPVFCPETLLPISAQMRWQSRFCWKARLNFYRCYCFNCAISQNETSQKLIMIKQCYSRQCRLPKQKAVLNRLLCHSSFSGFFFLRLFICGKRTHRGKNRELYNCGEARLCFPWFSCGHRWLSLKVLPINRKRIQCLAKQANRGMQPGLVDSSMLTLRRYMLFLCFC